MEEKVKTGGTPMRISLWSGPRNVSTALMYSFAQRPDTQVFDEPLYGHYLAHSDARFYHPGASRVIETMETDGVRVVRDLLLGRHERPVVFFKNMAHHLVELDWGFLRQLHNVLLIREPSEMLSSFAKVVNRPALQDTGYPTQVRLLEYLEAEGEHPIVLDARELLLDPRSVLGELCCRLGIPFSDQMLSWPPGPRPEEGIWAMHWYEQVRRSTGFMPYRSKSQPVAEHLEPLLGECRPLYERLYAEAIKAG